VRWIWIPVASLLLGACQLIAPYNQTAYQQATALKAEALILMDKATEPYAVHKTEAEQVRLDMDKAYEYAKGRPRNVHSTTQWEVVRDPARHSLGGFLKRWQTEGTLNATFIADARKLVSDQLDTISALESGKPRRGRSAQLE
jgi:hypothetical protein